MESKEIQVAFFKHIDKYNASGNLAAELTEILNIAQSGAYRRIKGETFLTLDELIKIMNHYDTMSFDRFVRPNCAPFILPVMTKPPKNMFDYLDVIEQDLKIAATYPNARISYAAQEVLFFHNLLVPEIAVFKLYMWGRTIWDLEETRLEKFTKKNVGVTLESHRHLTIQP